MKLNFKKLITNHYSLFTIHKLGFTLIEILVVVGLLGIIMVTVTNIFFAGFKAKRKTDSINVIKQSGSYAMSYMSKMIRNANKIKLGGCTDHVTIENPDGFETTFSCEGSSYGCDSTVGSERIAAVSTEPRTDCLTAANLYLNLADCTFTCIVDNVNADNPTYVTIDFTLANGTVSDIIGYASQRFKTTVSLRNY